jgi:thioredoxin-like negative regulator of GroEL
MHNTNPEQFDADVIRASFAKPVVVMFHAATCGPCRSMKPMVEGILGQHGITLVGVDAGEHGRLAQRFTVRAVPTILVFKGGTVVGTPLVGAKTEAELLAFLLKTAEGK